MGDVQLGPHLPDVDLLALERERGRSGRDPEPVHPGQHVDDLLGDAVGEKRVVRVGAHVDEGEHRDALLLGVGLDRLGSPAGGEGALLKNGHWPVLVGHEEDLHGPGHVLQLETSEGVDEHAWLILQVVVDPFGNEHLTGWTKTLDARGDVDTVSVDALSLTHNVTGVDADPEWDSRLGRQIPLNPEGAGHGLDGAAEDAQAAVAVVLEQITPAPRHGLLQDPAMPITVGARGFLVPLHEGRVARHVGEHDGG